MLFNSVEFLLFLPPVFLLYWWLNRFNTTARNIFLIAASLFFYGLWGAGFVALFLISAIKDYFIARGIDAVPKPKAKHALLLLSVVLNIGTLVYFKYLNFFIVNINEWTGTNFNVLRIPLPVGISFFTFHILCYTIDVYRQKIASEKNFINYLSFIVFFPQLVAGPITRAEKLLPQVSEKRFFNYPQAVEGMNMILWGMFVKIVIADQLSDYTNELVNNYAAKSGSTLLVGAFIFPIQLYCDFNGYSLIAVGVGKLLGIDLAINFLIPYKSASVTELWRRWHISLSTWMRDYLFTPISTALRAWEDAGLVISTIVTFVVVGIWHGASWTFLLFGFLHGIVLSFELLTRKKRKKLLKKHGRPFEYGGILLTFLFFVATEVIFFSRSVGDSMRYFKGMVANEFGKPELPNIRILAISLLAMAYEFWVKREDNPLMDLSEYKWLKPVVNFGAATLVLYYFGKEVTFIYFQF